jgi:hypothetical protein
MYSPDYIIKNFNKVFRESLKEKSIDRNVHFQDLSRSFAGNLIKKGVSLLIIK